MGVTCIAQERQPDHGDKLRIYCVARNFLAPHRSLGFPLYMAHIIILITTIPNQAFPQNQTLPIDKSNVNPSSEIFKLNGNHIAPRLDTERQITNRQYCRKPYP